MKIDELTGYKNNETYRLANDIFAKPSVGVSGYSKTAGRNTKLSKFTAYLENYGFELLGSGSFGRVYQKDGYPWAFKIFHEDAAYLKFIKYVIANQDNPHLPKIKGGLMKINDDTYVIRMEKLDHIWGIGKIADAQNSKRLYDTMIKHRMYFKDILNDVWIAQQFPQMMKVFRDLVTMGYDFDIGSGNVMRRGSTVVLVDPIFDESMM